MTVQQYLVTISTKLFSILTIGSRDEAGSAVVRSTLYLHLSSIQLISSVPESQSSLLSQILLNGMHLRVPGHWYSFGKHGIRFFRCVPEISEKMS